MLENVHNRIHSPAHASIHPGKRYASAGRKDHQRPLPGCNGWSLTRGPCSNGFLSSVWRDTTEFEAGGICILDVQNSGDLTRFLGHVLSYRLMTDEQLGRSDLIKSDEDGNYIMTRDAVVGPDFSNEFYIQAKPIALHGDQVSAGTTCYLARMPQLDRWNYVVKFKWRRASNRLEEEMLKAADEKNISGLVSLVYHKVHSEEPRVTPAEELVFHGIAARAREHSPHHGRSAHSSYNHGRRSAAESLDSRGGGCVPHGNRGPKGVIDVVEHAGRPVVAALSMSHERVE